MRRPPSDERGAVAVFLAVTVSLLIIIGAFAVDLGMQRVVRRDMQALADLVALDLTREIRGRTAAQIAADQTRWAAAQALSVERNQGAVGAPPAVASEVGVFDPLSGAFTPATGATKPNAVRVTASGSTDFSFTSGQGAAVRAAVAATEPVACFQLGSFALSVDSGNSWILDRLVGDALKVQGLSYKGLADARVSLLGLGAELGAGTVDELLGLGTSLSGFYLATATALQKQGGSTANVQLLQTLAAKVGPVPMIRLDRLLSLAPGFDAALAAQVNVLDLVTTSAFVINGANLLEIPGLTLNAGLVNATAKLKVIEKPRIGCGPVGQATAETAQVTLTLDSELGLPMILGTGIEADASLTVTAANAKGTLQDVTCGTWPGEPDKISVVTQDGLVTLGLDVALKQKLLGVTVLEGTATVASAPLAAPGSVNMTFADMAGYTTRYETGAGNIGLTGLTVQTAGLRLVGVPLDPLGALVTGVLVGVVNPLITTLDTTLLSPLLQLLGINVSGSDVWGVPRPNCGAVSLRR